MFSFTQCGTAYKGHDTALLYSKLTRVHLIVTQLEMIIQKKIFKIH